MRQPSNPPRFDLSTPLKAKAPALSLKSQRRRVETPSVGHPLDQIAPTPHTRPMSSATTLSLTLTDRTAARTIAGALQDLIDPAPDALTIFENPSLDGDTPRDWRIDAYFDTAPDADALRSELAAILDLDVPAFTQTQVPDENWVALSQKALPPVEAGRFVVHGSHDREKVGRRRHGIEIEAGEAFGTAHHATTYGCLKAIDRLTRRNQAQAGTKILDLGCGSGILAIALAKAWPDTRILATDVDEQSCVVAAENAAHNGVARTISVRRACGVKASVIDAAAPFDIVIANILAGPLIQLAPQISAIVVPGGKLILSGILVPQAPQVIAAYRTAGFILSIHDRITGWSTLQLVRRRTLA